MFRNILVSIDGSPDADRALSEAVDIARGSNGRLTLFTAVQQLPPIAFASPGGGSAAGDLFDELEREARETLTSAEQRVPDDVPVTTILSHDPVRVALMEAVRDGGHDLLAMGSRGRGAISAAVLGSVSHYALNHSPVPILIVPGHEDNGAPDG
jgi:nucleotide-binding universal stress UspA family protein